MKKLIIETAIATARKFPAAGKSVINMAARKAGLSNVMAVTDSTVVFTLKSETDDLEVNIRLNKSAYDELLTAVLLELRQDEPDYKRAIISFMKCRFSSFKLWDKLT